MSEVIVITSGKGGVGKTTTTSNIGTGLAGLGKKVVLMDTDIGLRNLDVVMGMENRVVYDFVDVLEEKCRLKQALIKDARTEGLYLLPAAQTRDKSAVNSEQMKALCAELKEEFDYVLVDCPAGIEQGFQNAVAGADRAIVVTIPEAFAVRDADRIVGLLEECKLTKVQLVVNRLRPRLVESGGMMNIDDVMDILAIPLLGVVPDEDAVIDATGHGEPVIKNQKSRAGQAYANIARRIVGEDVPIMEFKEKKRLFGRSRRQK